jgi:hypothetical protein
MQNCSSTLLINNHTAAMQGQTPRNSFSVVEAVPVCVVSVILIGQDAFGRILFRDLYENLVLPQAFSFQYFEARQVSKP